MGTRDDALSHLRKAREFLDAAGLELDMELHTAAASSAVLAGINAKDTICLQLTGRTGKSEDHRSAVPELVAAAADFSRLPAVRFSVLSEVGAGCGESASSARLKTDA